MTNLNWIIRANVQNDDTRNQIVVAFQDADLDTIPAWPGQTFAASSGYSNQFYAILGSKNGAGCGYLLATHKDGGFGAKTISEVIVWADPAWSADSDESVLKVNLAFHVVPYAS